MRSALPLILIATVTLLPAAAGASDAQISRRAEPVLTVSCRDANLRVAPADAAAGGQRIVLGAIAVPPAYIRQVARYGHDGWAYWTKAGVLIEAGSPVVKVSVAKAYRKRAAIAWGLQGPVSAQRFAPCSPPPTYWNGYVGGFFLKTRSACVPLTVQVGTRIETVRFGIGRRCP